MNSKRSVTLQNNHIWKWIFNFKYPYMANSSAFHAQILLERNPVKWGVNTKVKLPAGLLLDIVVRRYLPNEADW